LTKQHGHELIPAREAPGVVFGFEFLGVPGESGTLKKRKDLAKKTAGSNHLGPPWMMGCGFNFTLIFIRNGGPFQLFSEANLDTSGQIQQRGQTIALAMFGLAGAIRSWQDSDHG
jgi:hypothetical protein